MPRSISHPVSRANGVFYLKQRVPRDLAAKIKGKTFYLPVMNDTVRITANEKIIVSLRTKDRSEAKRRYAEALSALQDQFEALRQEPIKLTQKQIIGLAGEFYKSWIETSDTDDWPGEIVTSDELQRMEDAYAAASAAACEEAVALGESKAEAELRVDAALAALDEKRDVSTAAAEHDVYTLALGTGEDVIVDGRLIRYREAVNYFCGPEIDPFIAKYNFVLDDADRRRLLLEIGKTFNLFRDRLVQNALGDYSRDENLDRFPEFEPPAALVKFTIESLFGDWKTFNKNKKAPATIRRYEPSITSLGRFTKGCDVRKITPDIIFDWAAYRRDVDGIMPDTVNANDLVAAKTLFNHAMSIEFKRRHKLLKPLFSANPTKGIKLDPLKKFQSREPSFRQDEIKAILNLARSVEINPSYPRASASRRWAPFLCAYSGARIQEVCALKKEDIMRDGEVWSMSFPHTKNGIARRVPLHDALVTEGFLDFCKKAPQGYLFIDDIVRKKDLTRPSPEQRGSEIGAWIRNKLNLDKTLQPNHGWRHTFLTNAERFDIAIPDRIANAITGHCTIRRGQTADRYRHPPVDELKKWLDRYTPYEIR